MGCAPISRRKSVDVEMQALSGFLACEIGDPEDFVDFSRYELTHVLQAISVAIQRWMMSKISLQEFDIEFDVKFPDATFVRCINGNITYIDHEYCIERREALEETNKLSLSSELRLKFQWPRISPTIHYCMHPTVEVQSACSCMNSTTSVHYFDGVKAAFDESMKVAEFWLNIWLKEREYAMRLKVSEASIILSCILSNPSFPLDETVNELAVAVAHIVDASAITIYLKEGRRPRKLISKSMKCTVQENEGMLWRHKNDVNSALATGESSLHFSDIVENGVTMIQSVICIPMFQENDNDILRPLRAMSMTEDDDCLSECVSDDAAEVKERKSVASRRYSSPKSLAKQLGESTKFRLKSVNSVFKLITPSAQSASSSSSGLSSSNTDQKFCTGLVFILIKRRVKVSNVELIGLNEAIADISDFCTARKAELRFYGDIVEEERGFVDDYLSGRCSPESVLTVSAIVALSSDEGKDVPQQDTFFNMPTISLDDSILTEWCIDPFVYSDLELAFLIERAYMRFDLINLLAIPVDALRGFIWQIRTNYHDDNPFHNFFHAFSVVQATFAILNMAVRHRSIFSPLELAILLTAAYGHDADHPGTTNAFEISSMSEKAITYSDDSVLERHHCSVLFKTIIANNFTRNFTKDQFKEFRRNIVKIILSTDMSKHLQLCTSLSSRILSVKRGSTKGEAIQLQDLVELPKTSAIKNIRSKSIDSNNVATAVQLAVEAVNGEPPTAISSPQQDRRFSPTRQVVPFDSSKEQDRVSLMEIIVHCSDLSGQTSYNSLALVWGKRIQDEFARGQTVVKTQQERSKDQCFFISEILTPLWDPFVTLFPELSIALGNLKSNYNAYRESS